MPLTVEIANEQTVMTVDTEPLVQAVRSILEEAGFTDGEVSIALVDDATIHKLNYEYLQHDYATDVLSFVLEQSEGSLEGQIILSVETAAENAQEFGEKIEDEILLYAVHGALHLVGYEDDTPEATERMRAAERRVLNTILGENKK